MAQSRGFNLLRFFSLSSLLLILVIGATIVYFSRQVLTEQLVESGERANVALANSIANAIWERHAGHIVTVSETDGDRLRGLPETAGLHRDLERLVRGINVLKVKIYNTAATTIYSSEMAQIGESKADNAGFLTTLSQQVPASKLSRRGSFSAFSGLVSDVALVETYVPIVDADSGRLQSVFELYADVSPLVDAIDATLFRLSLILVGLLALLYLALFTVIRGASRTIARQRGELEQHQALLESSNEAMEKEIAERKAAERELARNRQPAGRGRVLPLVARMCQDVAREYLAVAGRDRKHEVQTAYGAWRRNKIRGPSSINIFINLLSHNLEGREQTEFETRARRCLRL